MQTVIHGPKSYRSMAALRRILVGGVAALAVVPLGPYTALAGGQGGYGVPSGMGGQSGAGGRPSSGQPTEEIPNAPLVDKPDVAAKKAYNAGMKSLAKARDYENAAAAAANPDKKANALEKQGDAYNRALDQFTEALSNNGDMVEAWDNVGYIHLRLGAYAESVDDYNHTLALKPDLLEAVEHRGEAYLGADRLEDAKGAYIDLFNHDRPLADRLLASMQHWLAQRRVDANGMRPSDIDGFDKWLQERSGVTAAR